MVVPAFRLTSRAREASASPSISLEKGRHRIRAPRVTNISQHTSLSASRRPVPTTDRNNLYLAILVMLLVFACLVSFGTAYYLYRFRWSHPLDVSVQHADEITQVIEVDPHIEACPKINSSREKYLSYLPHSGFHNQRIALENALTLSHILNRTLLIPPVRLGTPLRYVNYDSLYSYVALSGKENLGHCSRTTLNLTLPLECLDYFDYTYLSWEWLVDLPSIRARQPVISRWNLTDAWIRECLNISYSNTRVLKDSGRYHFRFSDKGSVTQNEKYLEKLNISALASFSEPLLQIGTLFGSSRLHLVEPKNRSIRSQIRARMMLTNPYLLHAAGSVAKLLGNTFIGIHVRLGDGQFHLNGGAAVRSLWRSLVQGVMGLSAEDATALEENFGKQISSPIRIGDEHSPLQCRGSHYSEPHLIPLNTPLYIATDANDPTNEPSLALFFNTFPCTFVLGDFLSSLTALDRIDNLYDGLKLKPFLLPFVDAMIVGKAYRAIGTPGSTFSAYVTDVLWQRYHDFEIAERG